MNPGPDPCADSATPPRSPGRPRCEESRIAILEAAFRLAIERPLDKLTSAEIAAEAGVSKATLYRWWPSKERVVLDAFFHVVDAESAIETTGDPLADLRSQVRRAYERMGGVHGALFAKLVASGHFKPAVMEQLNDELNSPRCHMTHELLTSAIASGQLRADLDPELVADLLFGPLFSRLMTCTPVEPHLADRVLDHVIRGIERS